MSRSARGISPATTVIFAVVGGVAVANVYYIQPLLDLIASGFHVSARLAGSVATMVQTGYALGILAFVPLGDVVQRRALIVGLFACVTVALIATAAAPSIGSLCIAMLVVGVTTTAPQILMPFAADLALPEQRGRVLGTVQTGLIVGTLAARALAGVLGEHAGWRSVYLFAAGVAMIATSVLARVLPAREPSAQLSYAQLMSSLPRYVKRFAALRVSMGLGFLSFGVFSGLWTVFAFHVRAIGYGADTVGFIGLVSLAGAVAAPSFGSLTDRYGSLVAGICGWAITLVAFVAYLVLGTTLWGLILASGMMAIGTQVTQIANQTRIFALDDAARSRINTVYMFTNFAGGAGGSLLAAWVYADRGWGGVCATLIAGVVLMGVFLLWLWRLGAPPALRFAPDARSS